MARSKSSARWLKEHFNDRYVQQAQKAGYRSRAIYKLMEIDQKDRLLKPGMTVVDLGAAPGGWSQYAAERVGENGAVIALDMLPMDELAGVRFIQGDFTEAATLERLQAELDGRPIDLVLSDMAPNKSGIKAVDQPRAMYLTELAVDFARQELGQGGNLLIKVFQGQGFEELYRSLKANFGTLVTRKPQASRSRSSEYYLLARNCKG